MKLRWNPFIGNFDYVGSTSGGGGGGVPSNVATVTHVANYSALPDPTTVLITDIYICDASQGTSWLPGSLGGTYYNKGVYSSNGTSWIYSETPYQATQAEVNTGSNTNKFVTPDTFTNSTKWDGKQDILSLTTLGTSGPSTLIGDVLNIPQYGGASTFVEYELDFGTTPTNNKTFTITDAEVDSSKKILIIGSTNNATGQVGNDWEVDSAMFSTKANTGSFTLYVNTQYSISGKRKIYYQILN